MSLFNFLAGFKKFFIYFVLILAGLCERKTTCPASQRGKQQERAALQTGARCKPPLVTQSLQAMFYGDLIT